jgi:hypothetical protein
LDLLTYQASHEQSLIRSANLAYINGDIEGAVGFIRSLSSLLGVDLPKQPTPNKSLLSNKRALADYFFRCSNVVSRHLGQNISEIRARYGNPFQLKSIGGKPVVSSSKGSGPTTTAAKPGGGGGAATVA